MYNGLGDGLGLGLPRFSSKPGQKSRCPSRLIQETKFFSHSNRHLRWDEMIGPLIPKFYHLPRQSTAFVFPKMWVYIHLSRIFQYTPSSYWGTPVVGNPFPMLSRPWWSSGTWRGGSRHPPVPCCPPVHPKDTLEMYGGVLGFLGILRDVTWCNHNWLVVWNPIYWE